MFELSNDCTGAIHCDINNDFAKKALLYNIILANVGDRGLSQCQIMKVIVCDIIFKYILSPSIMNDSTCVGDIVLVLTHMTRC